MEDVKFGTPQQCPKCGDWNNTGLILPEECRGSCLKADKEPVVKLPCSGVLSDADDYAYKNIEEYESIVDCKVNEAFRIGWSMARATMKQLRALDGEEEGR